MTSRRRTVRRWALGLASAAVAAASLLLWASRPRPVDPASLPAHSPDLAAGETIYLAGGCHGCHRAAPGASADARDAPIGSEPFPTPVGIFYPGNLTPDRETGLGDWTAAQFVSAMTRGVSPDGRHYFPAFPYTSYRAMRIEDLLDLFAYLRSLEPVRSPARSPEVPLLPLARRGVGVWKLVGMAPFAVPSDPARGAAWNRGAYLVWAPGHCRECHTPRDLLMRPERDREFAGGAHPGGEGNVPSLRALAARDRYRDASDLALALRYGEELGYDKLSSGGMARIQVELGRLPESEVAAIADYLMSLE